MTNPSGEGLSLRDLLLEARADVKALRDDMERYVETANAHGVRLSTLETEMKNNERLIKAGGIVLGSLMTGLLGLMFYAIQQMIGSGVL